MRNTAKRPLSNVDPRLLTEAFRRARERADCLSIDSEALFSAIIEAARRGERDMYTLVKAAGAAVEKRRDVAA